MPGGMNSNINFTLKIVFKLPENDDKRKNGFMCNFRQSVLPLSFEWNETIRKENSDVTF